MKLEEVVPWGRNLQEYKEMFLLSNEELEFTILSCADGPASFNFEFTALGGKVTSIDPLYQFSKEEIAQRVKETSKLVAQELEANSEKFIWREFESVDALVETRLSAMERFLKDYHRGKEQQRYIYQELPKLSFKDKSFDIILVSHFLFLYSQQLDLEFHISSIEEMCRIANREIRIFPLHDLENRVSSHLQAVLTFLEKSSKNYEIIETNYEFQKGVNRMLRIFC